MEGRCTNRYSERRVWGRANDKKARYLRLSGTSMAAAVTSGVVALMLEANRESVRDAADSEHCESHPGVHVAAAVFR